MQNQTTHTYTAKNKQTKNAPTQQCRGCLCSSQMCKHFLHNGKIISPDLHHWMADQLRGGTAVLRETQFLSFHFWSEFGAEKN